MKVSVLVMTYNHAKFIAQALDSVLMQDVDFEYEVIISEDYSTDGTREIAIAYKEKLPDRIRLLMSEHNLHSNDVVARGIRASRGRYIALLDGDDYWASPHKLQKQVNFLDDHPECSICFHNVNVIYEDASFEPHPFHMQEPRYDISKPMPKTISTLEDIVPGNFIQTCSVMFRAGLFSAVPDWYNSFFPITDWPLHILNAEHGNIAYLDEILGTYRVHSGGLWSMNMSLCCKVNDIEKLIYMYKTINRHLNFRYNNEIIKNVSPLYYKAMNLLFSEHNYRGAHSYAKKYFLSLPLRRRVRQMGLFKVMLKIYVFQVYDFLRMLKLIFVR